MINLRDYQINAIDQLREKFRQGKHRVILHLPTGAGKTCIFGSIAKSLVDKNIQVAVVVRRRDVVHQTIERFHKDFKIVASIFMGNEKGFKKDSLCHVCSIDTISRRNIDFLKTVRYYILDECHDCNSETYQEFLARIPENSYVIGASATPFNNLEFFEDVVCPVTPANLRDNGFLVPIVHYAPKTQIDVSSVGMVGNDYNQGQLAEQSGKITGDIVQHWIKYGENRPTIVFAVNKNHSKMIRDEFLKNNITATHFDDSSSKEERAQAKIDLESGKLKIICSIGIFTTGWDCPVVSCLVLARPTKSTILYVQMMGRVLRTFRDKENSIILDHAGAIYEHGAIYEDRHAVLSKKKKSCTDKVIRVTTCEKCYAVRTVGQKECPYCHHVQETTEREIIHEDGELSTIQYVDNLYLSMRAELRRLIEAEKWKGWKKSAKYFKLYEKYGDEIFKYAFKLEIPNYMCTILAQTRTQKI